MARIFPIFLLLAGVALVPACTLSRADQLARQSDRVETHLLRERDRLTTLAVEDPFRSERLGHLNSLHTELSIADVARKVAPRILEPVQVDSAYDVLEEVYSTIDWNIPLAPTDAARRPMPALFGPGGLDFSALQARPRPGAAPAY